MTLTKMWVPICLYCSKCTKFCQLILRKIFKIVATRCLILRLKCTKFNFGWGSAPDPAGGAYSTPPDPLTGFRGHISYGREERGGKGMRRGGEGKGKGEGKGRKRKGRGLSLPKVNFMIMSLAPGVTLAGHSRASTLQAGSADPPVSARQGASVPIKLVHSSQSSSYTAASTLRCTSSTDRTSTSFQYLRSAGICCSWSDDV